MRMATSTKANGSTIRPKDKAPTHTRMALSMKGLGSMINNMGREWSRGLMGLATKANILRGRKKEMGG